ncbi:DUF7024 domain-containing protein [Burkholderia pyrrocinia]
MRKPYPREDLELVVQHTADVWTAFRGARLFITGGTGFIGSWLLEAVQHANRTLGSLPRFLENVRGLSTREDWGRWSDANVFPDVELSFVRPLPARFTLHVRMQGYGPNIGKPSSIMVGQQTRTVIPGAEIREFALRFDNPTAARTIRIQPVLPRSPQQSGAGNDGRLLGVGIQKLWITTGDDPALESESGRYPAGA